MCEWTYDRKYVSCVNRRLWFEAVLKSRQALTPVLEIYAGDGTLVTHLDQVSDGDVLMYRCAHHPARKRPLSTRFFFLNHKSARFQTYG